jgi:DNA-directed RNA polymerase specialized sigma24 family protein
MSGEGSVSHWISELKAGDQAAAQALWERFFRRVVGLARKKLQGTARQARDEEDLALSVFDSVFRGAGQGRFPQLQDRDDLWQLLVAVTAHKAVDLFRRDGRQKRGGSAVPEQLLPSRGSSSSHQGSYLELLVDSAATPEFAAQMAEECGRLLNSLPDAQLKSVAEWKMEGYTAEEIAAKLQCAPRTVERRLGLIRMIWEKELS